METVVNDTNILIDLFNAGLLGYCKQLAIEFRTLDVIIEEITVEEQREAVNRLISDGALVVCTLSGEQITKVYDRIRLYDGICNLSTEDISVMVYAIDNKCRLLTGDKTLREKAELENVTVSGIIYLTDMLYQNGIVSTDFMIHSLRHLLESNSRLPKQLIRERIELLEKKSTDIDIDQSHKTCCKAKKDKTEVKPAITGNLIGLFYRALFMSKNKTGLDLILHKNGITVTELIHPNGGVTTLRIASDSDVQTVNNPEKIQEILNRWELITGHIPAYKCKEPECKQKEMKRGPKL